MIKLLLLYFLCINLLFSNNIKIASYNVENIFDLNSNKTDYKEYNPNKNSSWNKKTFQIKINNTIKVIKDLDAHIIALQEIENKDILRLIQKRIPQYKYISFAKYPNSSVGVGFLSKIKILDEKTIDIKFSNKIFRPILETTFLFQNIEFKIFNNHWPSKRSPESYRIKYAKKLFDNIITLPKDYDYILLGDFNSNYNEYETIFLEKSLNNTNGITGINHVLNTYIDDNFVSKIDIRKNKISSFYNPWLELEIDERFSSKFRGRNITPDNILLPYSLFDSKKLSYVENSFKVFKPNYLYKNKKAIRWRIKNGIHLGSGFSDHLPIIASFTANPFKGTPSKKDQKHTTIKDLYKIQKLHNKVFLKDCIVLFKEKNFAIIKQRDDRAIFIYSKNNNLKEGYSYDLTINQIKTFQGLKEIIDFDIVNNNAEEKNYKKFYYSNNDIDIFDLKNQNEIIKDIKGIYKKRYFYFNNKKVAIYFKNKADIPKNGSEIIIKRAHISYYMDKVQLTIFNKSDIKYVN